MIPLVPVLVFNNAGDPWCPLLVTGDSFDTVRKAHGVVFIQRCQRWPVITLTTALWESSFFISLMEKGERKICVMGR